MLCDAAGGEPTGEQGKGGDGEEEGGGLERGDGEGEFEDEVEEGGGPGVAKEEAGGGAEESEEDKFEEEDPSDKSGGGPEGAEEDTFAQALVAGAEDGGGEDDQTGDEGKEGHEADDESGAAQDIIEGIKDEGKVDGADIGKGSGNFGLEAGGVGAVVGSDGNGELGGGVPDGAEGKDEIKIIAAGFPANIADAADDRTDAQALNIPRNGIADTDSEIVEDILGEGYREWFGALVARDEFALEEGGIIEQMIAVGIAEFP